MSGYWSIGPVSVQNFVAACECLYQAAPEPGRSRQVREMAAALLTGELPSRYFFAAVDDDGSIAGVLWAMPARGKSAYVWPPVVSVGVDEFRCASDLLRESGRIFDADQLVFSQCLIGESPLPEEVFVAGGYRHVTRLRVMSVSAGELKTKRVPANGVHSICYAPELRRRFADIITRTFTGSTDCAILNKDRTGDELLDEYEPPPEAGAKNWRLYEAKSGEDVGVVLMMPDPGVAACPSSPAAKTVEIGYLGVVPEQRGRGLGRFLAVDAVAALSLSGETRIRVHVDDVNNYAISVYESIGFRGEDSAIVRIRRRFGT
jgi:ribosomal protein S18 acetylase RimI-like enzyme